ncbi:hypothetical protein M9H77_24976 [Catharanthus roseus]|uniref:Uncharacterized protein n=1 Tax=Catharanthus roseus TaxID=4058 RepID=A0ACC0A9T6_CATRO|nr:hypothetical protein M9H77_24976 [Catharanthus roseus]
MATRYLSLSPPRDVAAGMKFVEELIKNADFVQDQVLEEILKRNAKSEYLKQFLHGKFDKENFKEKVPIVDYEDISPFIERLTNVLSDQSSKLILNAEPIVELFRRQISDWIIDPESRKAVSCILTKEIPYLANEIEELCKGESWKGIIKKLWPKAKIIDTVVTEEDLLKAIITAMKTLESLGFFLHDYTSYNETSSDPGHYVLFWELQHAENTSLLDLDAFVMEKCCASLEQSFDATYREFRNMKDVIGPLEIRVVKQGTFDALMDFYISQGSSATQYKTPKSIKSEKALNILNSMTIKSYSSKSLPN